MISVVTFMMTDKLTYKQYSNGSIECRESYLNGVPHGIWLYWCEDGSQWHEHTYKHGKRHGIWRHWNIDGTFYWETYYFNDEVASKKQIWQLRLEERKEKYRIHQHTAGVVPCKDGNLGPRTGINERKEDMALNLSPTRQGVLEALRKLLTPALSVAEATRQLQDVEEEYLEFLEGITLEEVLGTQTVRPQRRLTPEQRQAFYDLFEATFDYDTPRPVRDAKTAVAANGMEWHETAWAEWKKANLYAHKENNNPRNVTYTLKQESVSTFDIVEKPQRKGRKKSTEMAL